MRAVGRILAALVTLGLMALLFQAVAAPESAERRIPLALLSVVALVAFARPGYLWILAVLVPVGPVIDFLFLTPGRGIYATEAILLAALCCWSGSKALGSGHSHPLISPALAGKLFVGFGLIGTLALVAGHLEAFNSFTAWRVFRVLVLAAGAIFIFRATAAGSLRNVADLWTIATMTALLLIAMGGLFEFIIRRGGPYEVGSFYDSSLGLAMHLAFFGPLALSVCLGPSQRMWRFLGAAGWVAALICLPLTASRGALGSFLITSVLVLVTVVRRTGRRGLRLMAGVLVVLGVALIVLATRPEIAGEAFADKFRATMAGDFFSTRVNAWSEAWQGISTNPVIGEGPDARSPSVPLELARRHGVPAALLALAAILAGAWMAGRRAWRLDGGGSPFPRGLDRASVCWGLSLGLVGLFLVGLTETGLGARLTPLLAWTLVMAGFVSGPLDQPPD